MDYLDFYDLYLKKFNYLVVGFDFKFGNKGLGTSEILSQIHKNVYIIDEIDFNDCKIGSLLIMNHINDIDDLRTSIKNAKDVSISVLVWLVQLRK